MYFFTFNIMLELVPNQSSMLLTPTYPARTGGGHGCRARSDGADADAEPCRSFHGPSSQVDLSAPITSSPPPCSFASSQGGISLRRVGLARGGHLLPHRRRSEMGPTGNVQRYRFGFTNWFTSAAYIQFLHTLPSE